MTLEERINSFRELKQNWDSYKADIISEIAIEKALSVLKYFKYLDPSIQINVFPSNGGIEFEFDSMFTSSELEIYKEGDFEYVEYSKDGDFVKGEDFTDFEKSEFFNQFIKPKIRDEKIDDYIKDI